MKTSSRARRTSITAALLAVPAILLVGACSSGGASNAEPSGGSADSGGSTATSAPDAGGARSEVTDSGGSSSAGKAQSVRPGQAAQPAVAPIDRAIVATGQISLRAKSLLDARAEVLRLTASWGGIVADEQTDSDDKGRIRSSMMTLRVPTPKFSDALTALGRLGEVETTSRSTEDVTTQVIDNDARVRAAERSIRQIEKLLDRATQLSDIITIEADLARRQADLDSLEQQRAWLADQTSLSTINVHLARLTAAPAKPHEASGFLAGLADGWHALAASTLLVLRVVGAVLPFALVLALLGVPAWLVLRRFSVRSTPARTP